MAWDVDRDPAGLSAEQRSVVLVTHAVVGGGALGRWLGRARVAARRAPVDPEPLSPVDRARDWLVERCGGTNLLYALLLLAASAVTRSPVPFVFGISFVHYLVYVATFHQRRGVAFPAFVRDALFFKTLSMTCLGLVWLSEARLEPVTALSLAVIAAGVGLSMAAARALGFERTYFGVELGRLAWRKVEQWPYGVVPHPMIVGASIALVGVLLLPGVREGWPWLVPMHLGLYLVHLVQEIRATPS